MAMELLGDTLRLTVLAGLGIAGVVTVLLWLKNLTRRMTYLRFIVGGVSLAAIFYMFTFPEIWMVLVVAVIIIVTLFLGRFFCGWICPFGLYMDLISQLRKATRLRYRLISEKLNGALNRLRYILLVFFLILPLFLVLPYFINPIEPFQDSFIFFLVGPFKPMSILLGPLEPLIIPWKGVVNIIGINLSYPYVTPIAFYSSGDFIWINALIFVALTAVASFFIRRFWCRFCPTGASLAGVNRFRGFKWSSLLHLDKDEEKCTKCGICKRVCPVQVTEVYEQKGGKITTSVCMLCLRCVEMCPYKACLKVKMGGKTIFQSRNWLEPPQNE
jgi:ferredoxin-type protein NapH